MDKASLEAKLPQLERQHAELTVELHRLEGEFRAIKAILNEWPPDQKEADKAQEEPQVDAKAQSS